MRIRIKKMIQSKRKRKISLTFARFANSQDFSLRFPRLWRASADRDANCGVVETYPLEPPAANLR
jgi:hypothetical protein